MKYGIIIPNYMKAMHHVRMLEQCLSSIKKHEPSLLINTFIVDDGSPLKDKTAILNKVALSFGCRVYFKSVNSGYSNTVNTGLTMLKIRNCNVAVTLNTDCEITTPFTSIATKTFAFDAGISVIGGLLYYPSGKIQSAGQTVPEKGGVIEHFKNIFDKADINSTKPCYVQSVTGAFQIFKMDAGLYSTDYKMAYEDVEFCMRQWAEGKRVFYQPHIKAIHREGATRGRFPSAWELESIDQFDKMRDAGFPVVRHQKLIKYLNNLIHKN